MMVDSAPLVTRIGDYIRVAEIEPYTDTGCCTGCAFDRQDGSLQGQVNKEKCQKTKAVVGLCGRTIWIKDTTAAKAEYVGLRLELS